MNVFLTKTLFILLISFPIGPNTWSTIFSTDAENPNNKGHCDKMAQSPIDLLDENDEQVNILIFFFISYFQKIYLIVSQPFS